ncbi:MAG TPA: heat-inducible transcription repressor HrcA [Leucothrix mucor]|nr:heat-inducible transcription repressor HrcA [Leucothrix mucor]
MPNHQHDLNDRAKHLLKVLVEGYIEGGQPVASTALARRSGLKLSSATIRNVMASLEKKGYIHSPHTSAGRVPTSRGYRLFVDTMVNVNPLDEQVLTALQATLNSAQQSVNGLIQSASGVLSGITQLAGIISVPRTEAQAIRHIEFLQLSATQVLVVMVMANNDVQNRIIQVESDFTSSELQQSSNYLNEVLVGKDIHQARRILLNDMKQVHEHMNKMMVSAIELGEKALDLADNNSVDDNCVIAGKTNLMEYDDLGDMHKLRQLFSAFNQKRDVLSLLDKSLQADGVQIFIGKESGYTVFDDCSVVTAPYQLGDNQIGVLGVIGPKRMQYDRVIPVVDVTAKLLSAALNSKT